MNKADGDSSVTLCFGGDYRCSKKAERLLGRSNLPPRFVPEGLESTWWRSHPSNAGSSK